MVFHNKHSQHASWAFHGQDGWYIGPAMDYYRNITAYFPKLRTEKVTDTVTFIPHDVPIPTITLSDFLLQAVEDIITILQTPGDQLSPTLKMGDNTRNALLEIATTLKTLVQPPASTPSPSTTSVVPLTESRVVAPQHLTVSQSRVALPQDTTPVSSIATDATDATIPSTTFSKPSTRFNYDGKRVPTPGIRVSKRLQKLKQHSSSSNCHIPN